MGLRITLDELRAATYDPAAFARTLLGQELWSHQLEVVQSTARYRVICAGRRAGKTRVFGVLALHTAFSRARSKVLIVSAGDRASKRMFADISGMAEGAPLLKSSVDDETTSLLTLTNGSQIECVPQSMAQVRSAEADLLIVDEAGFVSNGIWAAAEPVIVARPGSRALICSTPWGSSDHWFRGMWRQGMDRPDEEVRSWHWPSTLSPMVDRALLDAIRERSTEAEFGREYLAEWLAGEGAYFTQAELDDAVRDDLLVAPQDAHGAWAVGGVDWGLSRDASTLAVISVLPDVGEGWQYGVTWLEERFAMPYGEFIDLVAGAVARPWTSDGYRFERIAAESNGVGQYPAELLAQQVSRRGSPGVVLQTWTDSRLKQDSYGVLRSMLQRGELFLPRHPGLLKQLAGLEYTITDSGAVRLAVPDRVGHDDLSTATALAVHAWRAGGRESRVVSASQVNAGRFSGSSGRR